MLLDVGLRLFLPCLVSSVRAGLILWVWLRSMVHPPWCDHAAQLILRGVAVQPGASTG